MKTTFKLTKKYLESVGRGDVNLEEMPEELRIAKRLPVTGELVMSEDDEKASLGWISTIDVDEEGEVVIPAGMSFKRYGKNPVVLWNHDLNVVIGKSTGLSTLREGVKGKTEYMDDEFSEKVWGWVRKGAVRTQSATFIRKRILWQGSPGFDAELQALKSAFPEKFNSKTVDKIRMITTDSELVEYSVVSIPMNEDAVLTAVSKGLKAEDLKELGVDDEMAKKAIATEKIERTMTEKIEREWDDGEPAEKAIEAEGNPTTTKKVDEEIEDDMHKPAKDKKKKDEEEDAHPKKKLDITVVKKNITVIPSKEARIKNVSKSVEKAIYIKKWGV